MATEEVERLREERVRMPVVQRDVGRRPQHHEHAFGLDAQLVQHRGIGLEVSEVVLLLQPRIAKQLRRFHAEAGKTIGRNRVRHDHLRRRPHPEVVLERRELVVVRRRARDAEPSRGQGQLVRAVRERQVEASRSRPAAQGAESRGEGPRLPEP